MGGMRPAEAVGGTEASPGSDGRADNWPTSPSPSHAPVCPGGLAAALGGGIRGAFVPSLAVLSPVGEVGQREKKGGPCGGRSARRAVIGLDCEQEAAAVLGRGPGISRGEKASLRGPRKRDDKPGH